MLCPNQLGAGRWVHAHYCNEGTYAQREYGDRRNVPPQPRASGGLLPISRLAPADLALPHSYDPVMSRSDRQGCSTGANAANLTIGTNRQLAFVNAAPFSASSPAGAPRRAASVAVVDQKI